MSGFIHALDVRADANRSGGLSFNLVAAVRRSLKRRALESQLMRLDDRLLADIGLRRSDIAHVASWAAAEPASPKSIGLARAIVRTVRRWFEQRRAIEELMGLDQRMLADIGLTRSDIAAAVKGGPFRPESGVGIVSVLLRSLRLWQRSRLAAKTLSKLDDRALEDVGIGRSEIGCVAAELAERSLEPANSNAQQRVA